MGMGQGQSPERQAAMEAFKRRRFDRLDRDGDGLVGHAEVRVGHRPF